MKKRLISVMLIFLIILLSGCDYESGEPIPNEVQMEYSDFDLVVDGTTKIVYIDNMFLNANGNEYHIYTPYYSKNGKSCKFVDGKIVDLGGLE